MSFSKIYSSIVQSSLWTQPDHVRLLFITLLALADREGFVLGSRAGLCRIANLDRSVCERIDPFEVLMSPDDDSSDKMRNPENEGRRIEEIPGGFRILNYSYYRGLRNEDDRREQNKLAQRRYREKITSSNNDVKSKPRSATLSLDQPQSAHAEAEADIDNKNTSCNFVSPESKKVENIKSHFLSQTGKHAQLASEKINKEKSTFDRINELRDPTKALDGILDETSKVVKRRSFSRPAHHESAKEIEERRKMLANQADAIRGKHGKGN